LMVCWPWLAASFRMATFCQRACTSHRNSFVHSRCRMIRYMFVQRGASYLGKNIRMQNYYPKCKSSRYLEVDSSDGQKRQLTIPVKILRHLPFVPRIQWLYMTKESTKPMTWHKKGKWYNADKLVHPFDDEAWTRFDGIHREKADEARNVRVALAIDEFNPYGLMAAPYTCWPMFVILLNLPPDVCFQR
jgi:hypothetical protein